MSGPLGAARMPTRRHALIAFAAAAGIGLGGLAGSPAGQALAEQISGSATDPSVAGAVAVPSPATTPIPSVTSDRPAAKTDPARPAAKTAPARPAAKTAPAGSAHWRVAVAAAAAAAPGPTVMTTRRRGPVTISRLSVELHHRLDRAAAAAAAAGARITVTSGWRSPAQQERLIRYYTRKVGSRTAAYRWALPVDQSLHVTGEAVDIGSGAAWLRAHGAAYGLCRRYRSEPWHFEMLTEPGGRCPALEDHPVAH